MKFYNSEETKKSYKTAGVECAKAREFLHSAIDCIDDAKNQFGPLVEEPARRELVVITDELYDFARVLTAASERFKNESEKKVCLETILNKLDKTMNKLLQTLRD